MKSYGALYVQKIKYPHRNFLPLVERGWTTETEYPYRKGSCLVFRVPFTKPGFVLGLWNKPEGISEEDALMSALEGRIVDYREVLDLDV